MKDEIIRNQNILNELDDIRDEAEQRIGRSLPESCGIQASIVPGYPTCVMFYGLHSELIEAFGIKWEKRSTPTGEVNWELTKGDFRFLMLNVGEGDRVETLAESLSRCVSH